MVLINSDKLENQPIFEKTLKAIKMSTLEQVRLINFTDGIKNSYILTCMSL